MAKSIMVQGTMSNAGKSLLVAGLCRIFKQDGYRVAPFKSQNMALNSYITKDNLEMGRAQVVQAQAAGIEPDVRMNPILLKPTTDMGSQVIVNGKVVGNMKAVDYFKKKKEYIPVIKEAYGKLSEEVDIIVIEGAGSPAEINLKEDDIVNMGLANLVDAPVLLVGDIDRGGVFAQLVGTVMLLEPEEQERIKGLIINKFRGDVSILQPGLQMLEERCQKKVLGVVPYEDLHIEDEDSLGEDLNRKRYEGGIDIAVIRLPKISNFTDFQALSIEPMVSLRYVERVSELGFPDVIILPGTKNTIADMRWLRESGLEGAILRQAKGNYADTGMDKKAPIVFGICGGYQMLGTSIEDVAGVEGYGVISGMGLLPIQTSFEKEKTRTRVTGKTFVLDGIFSELSEKKISGYEIHMGTTQANTSPVMMLFDEAQQGFIERDGFCKTDGCYQDHVMGTYLHGIFDEDEFRESFIKMLCERKGISCDGTETISYKEYKEQQYDKLADILRESLDMDAIYSILG